MEKPSCGEGVDPTTGSLPRRSGSPRQRMFRHAEAQARGPLGFTKVKTNLRQGEGRTQQKTISRLRLSKEAFTEAKDVKLEQQTSHF